MTKLLITTLCCSFKNVVHNYMVNYIFITSPPHHITSSHIISYCILLYPTLFLLLFKSKVILLILTYYTLSKLCYVLLSPFFL